MATYPRSLSHYRFPSPGLTASPYASLAPKPLRTPTSHFVLHKPRLPVLLVALTLLLTGTLALLRAFHPLSFHPALHLQYPALPVHIPLTAAERQAATRAIPIRGHWTAVRSLLHSSAAHVIHAPLSLGDLAAHAEHALVDPLLRAEQAVELWLAHDARQLEADMTLEEVEREVRAAVVAGEVREMKVVKARESGKRRTGKKRANRMTSPGKE